jgi:hypothetical protein
MRRRRQAGRPGGATAALLTIVFLGCGGSGAGGHGGAGSADAGLEMDCDDGLDNDGDGRIDCADPACQAGYACVDGPVSGWEGALLVQRVPYPAASPPSPCPDGKAPGVYLAGPSDGACTPCACSLPSASCLLPEMSCSVMSGLCMGQYPPQVYDVTDTACHGATAPFPNHSCRLSKGSSLGAPGACTTTGGTPTPAAPWAEEVRVCAASGGGCGPGQVCAPKIPPGFEAAICMSQEGDAVCPAGWTDVELPVFQGGSDQRVCSACGCDSSALACESGQFTLYAGDGCTSTSTIVIDGTCRSIMPILGMQDAPFSYEAQPGALTGLACTGGTPSGSVETTGPLLLCCKKTSP